MLGCLVPTVNQVMDLLNALQSQPGFGFIEVEELLLRAYKPVAARLRPEDQMVGHTGYLIFARAVIPSRTAGAHSQSSPVSHNTDG